MTNWAKGYTPAELEAAQDRFGVRFPVDLVELLRERRPAAGYDWRTDVEAVRDALRRPLEGVLFNVAENAFWFPEWGERPASAEERARVASAALATAPKLIPIIGHRYIPEESGGRGNPVFSVYQTDVIYYGADLDDFFRREFRQPGGWKPISPRRRIPFWSDLAEADA